MASNRGYTTAAKVREVMAGNTNAYFTDGIIESAINRIEGIIDARLALRGIGANSFTWTTGTSTHWVVEGAATYGAALQCVAGSASLWANLDQLVNAQNTYAYMYKIFMDIIESDFFSDRVLE